jgi:hypothetical protein
MILIQWSHGSSVLSVSVYTTVCRRQKKARPRARFLPKFLCSKVVLSRLSIKSAYTCFFGIAPSDSLISNASRYAIYILFLRLITAYEHLYLKSSPVYNNSLNFKLIHNSYSENALAGEDRDHNLAHSHSPSASTASTAAVLIGSNRRKVTIAALGGQAPPCDFPNFTLSAPCVMVR